MDGLAQALIGAAGLGLGTLASVIVAGAQCVFTFARAPMAVPRWRRLGFVWVVVAIVMIFGALFLGAGGADPLIKPLLPAAIVGPIALTALAFALSERPGSVALIWANRLLPVAWLAFVAWVLLAVFPQT